MRDRRERPESSSRVFRPREGRQEERRGREREPPNPAPLNGQCTPTCPLFWCEKRTYVPVRDKSGNTRIFCKWVGDDCIGYSCQYATCKLNYMLPNGSCGWTKQRRAPEEEARGGEVEGESLLDTKLKKLLLRKYGGKLREEL